MKTITNRKNERYEFLTIVFATREEALKNADEDLGDSVSRVIKALHGEDGFAVKTTDGFKEFIKVAV